MSKKAPFVFLIAFAVSAGIAFGQNEPTFYPNKGQNQQQIEKDKFECYILAKQETGFDPLYTQPVQTNQDSTSGGVPRGTAMGTAVGAIGGDVVKGAARGTAIGIIRKRVKEKKAAKTQEQHAAVNDAKRKEYDRAYSMCLEGRGYTLR